MSVIDRLAEILYTPLAALHGPGKWVLALFLWLVAVYFIWMYT